MLFLDFRLWVVMTDTGKSKPNYHHGNLRQALIDAAIQFIRHYGAEKMSLRAIAREVGVSQSAPYRHFEDKNALVSAIASQGFELLRDDMRRNFQENKGEPLKALKLTGISYVTFAYHHPEMYRLMFGQRSSQFDGSELKSTHSEGYCVLREIIDLGKESGTFRPYDTDMLALAAWSTVHGVSSLILDGLVDIDETSLGMVTQSLTEIVINGVSQ